MASLAANALFKEVAPAKQIPHAKVTVVGVGQVGMACAYSVLLKNYASEICLMDVVPDKLKGEMMDMQHGLPFIHNCTIKAGMDYAISAGSTLCIITAGARQQEGETRLALVQRNVNIFKGIVPNLVKHSPNTMIMVVANPVDVLTYVAWKLSGLPKERVFGSGTNLDSARFRFLIAESLNIAPSSCHGWIIGEHGDSSVPVWSGVNVAGVSVRDVVKSSGINIDNWEKEIHKKVVDSAYEIIKLKGYTSWAIGLSCATIANALFGNRRDIFCLSVNANGLHGIKHDVYLSLPCVLDENGLTHIVKQNLNADELSQLQKSSVQLYEVQSSIQF